MALNLRLENEIAASLEALAIKQGILRGERGNVTKLLKAIASKQILLHPPFSPLEQDCLIQCLRDTIEGGHSEAATVLGEWLLNQPLLSTTHKAITDLVFVRSDLINQISNFISQKQPFLVSYTTGGADEQFICVSGQLQHIERHRYLVSRVTEVAKTPEHPNLAFNRCFRLDRIITVQPVKGEKWSRLGTIKAKFWLFGNWTKQYESKLGDEKTLWLNPPGGSSEAILEVTREIWSFFWTLRELRKYSKIQIIEPEELKSQHITALKENLSLYDL